MWGVYIVTEKPESQNQDWLVYIPLLRQDLDKRLKEYFWIQGHRFGSEPLARLHKYSQSHLKNHICSKITSEGNNFTGDIPLNQPTMGQSKRPA